MIGKWVKKNSIKKEIKKETGQPLSQDGWPYASHYRLGNHPGRNAVPESVCSGKQMQKQTCQETGCESGRRIGRRARSSTEATLRRTAKIIGFRLEANCATPASQVF